MGRLAQRTSSLITCPPPQSIEDTRLFFSGYFSPGKNTALARQDSCLLNEFGDRFALSIYSFWQALILTAFILHVSKPMLGVDDYFFFDVASCRWNIVCSKCFLIVGIEYPNISRFFCFCRRLVFSQFIANSVDFLSELPPRKNKTPLIGFTHLTPCW